MDVSQSEVPNSESVTTNSYTETEHQPASAPETTRYNVGKVRQLFAERRKLTAAVDKPRIRSTAIGRDKSYPLKPLKRYDNENDEHDHYCAPLTFRNNKGCSSTCNIKFNEVITPDDVRSTNLVKISSWPTINNALDTSIFGRLPNLGGKLQSESRREQTIESPTNFSTMSSMVRSLNPPPSRIPQKTTSLSVSKLTERLSKLDASGNNSKPSPRQHIPISPKRIPSPLVKNTRPQQTDRKAVNVPTNSNISNTTTAKPVNGLVKNNASTNKKPVSTKKPVTPPGMRSCAICGRHFANDRVQKHEEICEKNLKKKRKVFDPMKQRLKGTDAENMLKTIKKTVKEPTQPKATNWRKQHEEFIANIRAARQVKEHLAKGGKLSDLPPPPPMDTSSYTPCPHCGRKFNEAAAERHIAACANMRHNKPKPTALTKADTNKITRAKIVNRKR